jgi:hypothetical protein
MPAVIRRVLAIAGICAGLAFCSGSTAIALPFITPHGVGALRLHATVEALHRQQLIGGLRKGCELIPGQRIAPLRPPLRGWAVFGSGRKRLTALTIEEGAETVRHIGIGSTANEARQAYPDALYVAPGLGSRFVEGSLWVPNVSKPKLTMIIEAGTELVEAISVPSPSLCE